MFQPPYRSSSGMFHKNTKTSLNWVVIWIHIMQFLVMILLTYLLTYLLMELSPSREAANCAATQNFPTFYGTRRFITALTRALYWSLSFATSIQSPPSHPISLRSILILSTHLRFGLPSGLVPSGFPTNILYAFLVF
jgi:hypothetical protein